MSACCLIRVMLNTSNCFSHCYNTTTPDIYVSENTTYTHRHVSTMKHGTDWDVFDKLHPLLSSAAYVCLKWQLNGIRQRYQYALCGQQTTTQGLSHRFGLLATLTDHLRPMTHAPETGAINQLHFSGADFWYVCHAISDRILLIPDSGAD